MKEGKKEERDGGQREGRKKIGELTRMIRFYFGQEENNLPTHYNFLLFHRKQTLKMKICQKT